MPRFAMVEAPSILGLHPAGARPLPEALRAAGLTEALGADDAGRVEPPDDPRREPATDMLDPDALAAYSVRLADRVEATLREGAFPIVLGGDGSVLIGNALALKRLGRFGLFFLHRHAAFSRSEASSTGEAAEMALGIVTGRGPAVVSDLEGRGPYVRDEDAVVFDVRDEAAAAAGSRDVRGTRLRVFDLRRVRELGATTATGVALQPGLGLRTQGPLAAGVDGFWIHLDADVLDDAAMPAGDERLPGGLSAAELREVLRLLMRTGRAIGLAVTISNPRLDPDGAAGRALAAAVIDGLRPSGER